MRETCARVLAAALMTGAIGFALAMPAIFETTPNAGRSLTAPPSFLQRSVDVVASAPSRSASGGRLEDRQPTRPGGFVTAAGARATRDGNTTVSSRHPSRADRSAPQPKPAPKPRPVPAPTRELADSTPPAADPPPTPTQPAASPSGTGKGKKKTKPQAKKVKPAEEATAPVVAAPTPEPANDSTTTDSEKDHGKGNGNGKDKDKDKGKSDDKGRDG